MLKSVTMRSTLGVTLLTSKMMEGDNDASKDLDYTVRLQLKTLEHD